MLHVHAEMADHIVLTADKLSVEEVTQLVSSPDCGAVSLFVGKY